MVASEDERKAQIARDMAMLRASGDKNLRSSKENANKIKLTKEVEKRANLLDVAGGGRVHEKMGGDHYGDDFPGSGSFARQGAGSSVALPTERTW